MAYLLRKISRSKWAYDVTLDPQEYEADSITACIRTHRNTLSVWSSDTDDFGGDGFNDLIVGIAVNMDRADSVDVVWFEEEKLKSVGLKVEFSDGDSKFKKINKNHRDIVGIKHKDLALVGQQIVNGLDGDGFKRITKQQVVKLVTCYFANKELDFDDLSYKWQLEISKKIISKKGGYAEYFSLLDSPQKISLVNIFVEAVRCKDIKPSDISDDYIKDEVVIKLKNLVSDFELFLPQISKEWEVILKKE